MVQKKEREILVRIPESQAKRLEEVTQRDLSELIHALVMEFFEDGRRQGIPTKRVGLGWQKDVYQAMMKHVGEGGMSRFVRDAVYHDLSRFEKGLVQITHDGVWKDARVAVSSSKKRKTPKDRISVMAPMVFPLQWVERIQSKYPGKVGPYIKAVTQQKLEKLLGKQFPVQKGLGPFLSR